MKKYTESCIKNNIQSFVAKSSQPAEDVKNQTDWRNYTALRSGTTRRKKRYIS